MKKYFVLALALVAFAVAPVMADAKVSGEYRYGGMWNTGDEEYVGETTRMRVAVDAAIDDYNSFATRVSPDADDAVFDYYYLSTDWGKFFGTTDMGFGITTAVGKNEAFETEDVVGFTIYDFGGEGIAIEGTEAIKVDFDVMGMVKPYFSTSFRAFDAPTGAQAVDEREYFLGAVIDVAPVTASVYFGQVGVDEKAGRLFGIDAQGSMEVADGVDLTVGGVFEMASTDADEWAWSYLFGASVGAYGATVDLALFGLDDTVDTYALSAMALSAKYDILKWLGVQAGFQMAFGDFATEYTGDESFLGAEFGLYVMPGKAKYGLGYVIVNEDADSYDPHDGPLDGTTTKGGIYFTAQSKF